MRADFPVVLDACVLAEAAVHDVFLRLAEDPRSLWKPGGANRLPKAARRLRLPVTLVFPLVRFKIPKIPGLLLSASAPIHCEPRKSKPEIYVSPPTREV